MKLTRREVLGSLVLPPVIRAADFVRFGDYGPDFRLDVQKTGPRVKLFDLRNLGSWTTPAEEFFTFHQTQPAVMNLDDWKLEITGAVAKPRILTYSELAGFPARRVPATIECAGNTKHQRIMNGLVSNAVWTGVELAPLLQSCGVLPEAREVVFFGSDVERERKWPVGDRELAADHGRSIFIQDALEGGAILAMQMNSALLPLEHGYPVRLIFPGWYGVAQVKWLRRIVVLDRRYEGRHMARNYHSIRNGVDGLVMETSIGRNRLKSVIARVERIGRVCRLSGAAWGGSAAVDRVEIRVNGESWRPAVITRKGGPHGWSLWNFDWNNPVSGTHSVVSRAIDTSGAIQPEGSTFLSSREEDSQWRRTIVIG